MHVSIEELQRSCWKEQRTNVAWVHLNAPWLSARTLGFDAHYAHTLDTRRTIPWVQMSRTLELLLVRWPGKRPVGVSKVYFGESVRLPGWRSVRVLATVHALINTFDPAGNDEEDEAP